MKLLLKIAAVLAIVACTAAANVLALEVPKFDGRRVNDYANMLTISQRNELENTLRDLERRTTAQVAIVVIESLKGEDLAYFQTKLFNTWHLGQKNKLDGSQKKDNGVLITVSKGDKKVGIAPGKGLEGAIPDLMTRRITDAMKPSLGKGDYYAAFKIGIKLITERIDAEYGTEKKL